MPRKLPSGTVTFAFTDVVGSTRAFIEHGPAYVAALPVVHRAIAASTTAHHGVVVETEGDGAFLAFPDALQGLEALREIQSRLERQPDDGPWLRVRIGAHTAEAEPVDDGYLALGVHVAARVSAAACAGQVLLSQALVDELGAAAPQSVVDLGAFDLKDIREPVRLWRACGDSTSPRATPARHTNVAEPLTSFLGRQQELEELDLLLGTPGLVSVVGPGGTGKTRLVSEYALSRASGRPSGIWLVQLASLTGPGQLLGTMTTAAGFPGTTTVSAFADELARRGDPILVLDNCEHLVDSVADLVHDLLVEARSLRILVTSREPLEVPGERVLRLRPLATGRPGDGSAVADDLFIARARSAGASLGPSDRDVVRDISLLLDGLPLAVELAAARVGMLPPTDLLANLRQGRVALRQRGGPARQRNLESLVGWSLDLLDDRHRDALRVLSVIPDRFSASMAVELLARMPGLPANATVELARRSLIDLDGSEYRMLSTIRDVVRADLVDHPDLKEAATEALFDWAVHRSAHPDTLESVSSWEARAMEDAVAWGLTHQREGAGDVMRQVARWATTHTRSPEVLSLAETVIATIPHPTSVDEVRLVSAAIRVLIGLHSEVKVTEDLVRRVIAAGRGTADPETLREVAGATSSIMLNLGFPDEALSLQQEAVHLAETTLARAGSLADLGWVHHMRGELEEAERIYEEALAITPPEVFNHLTLMGNIAEAQLDAGRFDQAAAQARKARRAAQGDPMLAAWTLGLLAIAEIGRGPSESARSIAAQAEAELVEVTRRDSPIGYVLDRLREVRPS
ncbi:MULTISPECIES: ATP-binding protein [unclassified Nocardioides]|uniref:ATP-binding protein n=1 Tax=unclassified Nocardioides TaxID=2615069 RepID=UPI0006F7C714|nr:MULTISPECIES: tetratricopeptide repeat protein [unclassified Nocardioides]KRA28067.1 hypothetical protein ASD81_23150 [Nocardioides sp. Root614]KRA86042.1 hypothetical protein ASD84_23390 [Nocardioides sp. Root682]